MAGFACSRTPAALAEMRLGSDLVGRRTEKKTTGGARDPRQELLEACEKGTDKKTTGTLEGKQS